jgi:hypothetical protein
MATKTLIGAIQLRHDSAANWADKNPVLKEGEIGVETDTNKMKIGNGTLDYNHLAYFGGIEENSYVATAEAAQTDLEAINAVVNGTELHDGDTAVVKRLIAGDKYSYTAYVYNASNWKAMDGNYSADNVYFDEDLTYTASIGVYSVPSSGSGTIDAEGKSVSEVLKGILAKEKNPSTTQPSISLSSNNIKAYEVGSKVAINYSIDTKAGSYTYGPATGVTFSNYSATFNGETLSLQSGTFTEVQVTDSTSLSISASCDSSDGTVPKTNIGNNYTDGQIKAKSLSASKGTLTGYRNWFYGYKNASGVISVPSGINSAMIRALNSQNGGFPGTLSTNGMQQMFFAIPKGKKSNVAVSNNVNGAPCTVSKVTDIMVEGANGYDAIAYDVWYVNNAAADSGANTYKIVVS